MKTATAAEQTRLLDRLLLYFTYGCLGIILPTRRRYTLILLLIGGPNRILSEEEETA